MKRYRDPRNKSLMKMFNLISIGERSGSGVPNIFNTWADEGWKEPVIEERFDPDRTILTLEFVEKQAIILRRYMNILHNMVKVKQMILLHILV
jgi:predicted HTH transcriptional regulator